MPTAMLRAKGQDPSHKESPDQVCPKLSNLNLSTGPPTRSARGCREMPKDWGSLNVHSGAVPTGSPVDNQRTTAKKRAVQEAIATLKPITTFAAIGAAIGFSRQYVSKKMQERFKDDPTAMWLKGSDWRIPGATAELWIGEFYDT